MEFEFDVTVTRLLYRNRKVWGPFCVLSDDLFLFFFFFAIGLTILEWGTVGCRVPCARAHKSVTAERCCPCPMALVERMGLGFCGAVAVAVVQRASRAGGGGALLYLYV